MCISREEKGLKGTADTIEAVFFDFGGTLDAPGTAWRDHFYPIYVQAGVNVPEDVFARAFYASDDSLVAENPAHLNLSEIVLEQVRRVLEHLQCFKKELQEQIASRFLEDSFSSIKRNRRFLKKMHGRVKMGIISNNYGNLEMICRETGLDGLVDVMVDSNIVGCTKPDPEIFRAGLSAMGVDAFSAAMVGDSLARDIKGAQAVGMKAIWLAPNKAETPGREDLQGITVISGLHELPGLLDS